MYLFEALRKVTGLLLAGGAQRNYTFRGRIPFGPAVPVGGHHLLASTGELRPGGTDKPFTGLSIMRAFKSRAGSLCLNSKSYISCMPLYYNTSSCQLRNATSQFSDPNTEPDSVSSWKPCKFVFVLWSFARP